MAKEGEQTEAALKNAKIIFEKEVLDQTQLSVSLDGLWPCRPNCRLLWQVVATDNKKHDYVGHVTLLK